MVRKDISPRMLFLVLLLSAPARASVGLIDSDAVSYSTKNVAGRRPENPREIYIGQYGETLSFGDEWTLHTPLLQQGMEIVRFHSNFLADRDAPSPVIKESDFEKVENYWPLRLTQLLVIPEKDPAFNFAGLRAAKEKELKAQGAAFEFKGAPAPDYSWPKNTFQVFVTAPYRIHQLYAEDEGKLFILTGGLDEKDGKEHFFQAFFEEEFIGSLGDYFGRLHPEAVTSVYAPPPEVLNMTIAKRLCPPLLAVGLFLFVFPWARRFTRPLAFAAMAAAGMGAAFISGGFYLARFLVSAGQGSLVSPGIIGWMWIPVLIGLTSYRSMRLEPARRWGVCALSVIAALLLAGFAVETRNEIARGQFPVATDFSLYMFCVGILYGICLGLSARDETKSVKKKNSLPWRSYC